MNRLTDATDTRDGAAVVVNDIHSQLNRTRVRAVARPATVEALRATVNAANISGVPVAIAGGRHAMGGQQFVSDGILVDTRSLNRVVAFDAARGWLTAEGGIQWPEVMAFLTTAQRAGDPQWGIVQKQTGADRLSLAGALACNAHGRGLTLKPIVDQVEAFDLMDAAGNIRTCSRDANAELFRLAIGGYGLFGVITRVVLRLRRRVKVRRVVEMADTDDLIARFDDRIRHGCLYGDFQFAIDAAHPGFLRRGVFSCYAPVSDDTPLTAQAVQFDADDWSRLTLYAHVDKRRAFDEYAARYLETSGQIYWADAQLAGAYVDGYHEPIDRQTHACTKGSEMITEVYVPRPRLRRFIDAARGELRRRDANVIYGTIRLIERDDETFLAWAREPYACIVFNLHVEHTPGAIAAAADAFRSLIDLAIAQGGSFYLTYHRWARRSQVSACYPQMREFLICKRAYDPGERFQSEWYRHYRAIYGLPRAAGPVGLRRSA